MDLVISGGMSNKKSADLVKSGKGVGETKSSTMVKGGGDLSEDRDLQLGEMLTQSITRVEEGVEGGLDILQEVIESRNISQFLDLGSETLPPKAALSLASMIGLAMVVQQMVSPSRSRRRLSRRILRRRLPNPISELDANIPYRQKGTPYDKYGDQDYEYADREEPYQEEYAGGYSDYSSKDFENPDYEYVDQEEIERLKGFWENNRKTSEANNFNLDDIQLDFDQLDYENYDYAGIGVLNFNKEPPSPSRRPNRRNPAAKISKRQHIRPRATVHIVRRKRPQVAYGFIRKRPKVTAVLRPRVGTSPFLEGLGSRFDFGTMVSIAGFWYIWQAYLSDFVPTTIVQDIVNNVGGFGRSSDESADKLLKIVQLISQLQESSQHYKHPEKT